MPGRALLERRPWLLASIAAAIAYYGLKDAEFPGIYLLAIEAASLLLLSAYALLRHRSGASLMTAAAMALGGAGVVAVELDPLIGTLILTAGLGMLIGVFIQHRRRPAGTQPEGSDCSPAAAHAGDRVAAGGGQSCPANRGDVSAWLWAGWRPRRGPAPIRGIASGAERAHLCRHRAC